MRTILIFAACCAALVAGVSARTELLAPAPPHQEVNVLILGQCLGTDELQVIRFTASTAIPAGEVFIMQRPANGWCQPLPRGVPLS